MSGELAIVGCGVVSPAGIGLDPLADALRDGFEPRTGPLVPAVEEALPEPVRAVPALDVTAHVGRKGTRYLDRTTALGLVAARLALLDSGDERNDTGVVIGTSGGSVGSISAFARETLVHDRPYLVDAARFPNTVMNCCAGQIAIFNGLRGMNATVAGGNLSGLYALRYARNALRNGHAERLLIGAVEELCPQTAWAWRVSETIADRTPIGEGCALFMVEEAATARAADHRILAEVLSCEVSSEGPADTRPPMAHRLRRLIDRTLSAAGRTPDEVTLAAPGATGLPALDRAERRGLALALGREVPLVDAKEVTGECFSANGALQMAAVLARWRERPEPGLALLTSLGHDGAAGCVLLAPEPADG